MPVEIVTGTGTGTEISDYTFLFYFFLTLMLMCVFCMMSIIQQNFYLWKRLAIWIIITVCISYFLYIDDTPSNTKLFTTSIIGLGVDYYFFWM